MKKLLRIIFSIMLVGLLGCENKIPIYIQERAGTNLFDYQVKIVLNDQKYPFKDNENNIAFLDENKNELNYWIETWDKNTKIFKAWVKVPSLAANQIQKIYLYPNRDVPGQSNGKTTFDFFDDFEGNSLDSARWTEDISKNYDESLSIRVENSVLKISTKVSNADPSGSHALIKSLSNFTPQHAMRIKAKANTDSLYPGVFGFGQYSPPNSSAVIVSIYTHHKLFFYTANNPPLNYPDIKDSSRYFSLIQHTYGNEWHFYDLLWSASTAMLQKDDTTNETNADTKSIPTSALPISIGDLGQWGGGPTNTETNVDWILIRKYVYPEPEILIRK